MVKPAASGDAEHSTESTESGETKTNATDSTAKFSGTAHVETTVILGTAIVRVRDSLGKLQTARVLLDRGSQVSAITSECATRLGLKRNKSRIEVSGLSEQPVTKAKGVTHSMSVYSTSCRRSAILCFERHYSYAYNNANT